MRTVSTVNSIYEIDEGASLIRRIVGAAPPTSRQGTDGEWKAYASIIHYNGGLLIVWGLNPDGSSKCTWTSDIVSDTTTEG